MSKRPLALVARAAQTAHTIVRRVPMAESHSPEPFLVVRNAKGVEPIVCPWKKQGTQTEPRAGRDYRISRGIFCRHGAK